MYKKYLKYLLVAMIWGLLFFMSSRLFFTFQNQQVNYFWNNSSNSKIQIRINLLSERIHKKDYWLQWGHWWELLSHTFYWYSLTSIALEDNTSDEFKKFSIEELQFILEYINTKWKKNFINKDTNIPLWIIYQGHKNQILASLVLLWEDEYLEELYKQSEFIAWYYANTLDTNLETYAWRSWYVDNVNAIYSLFLTDKIRLIHWEDKLYDVIIDNWLKDMNKNKWEYGLILSESTWPQLEKNQSRWPAMSWSLVYLYELDKEIFDEQYKLYKKYFLSTLWLVYDIPDWQEVINSVSAWPVLLWYSSSASVLSLWIFKKTGDEELFYKSLKALDMAFFFNWEEYIFWNSTLIDALMLWGTTINNKY